jgi:glycosyltransferase involved in cell wall biosynthesis
MDPKSGGPCQGIRNSTKAMKRLGVENEVVCLDDPNSSFISKDDFKIYALGPAKGPWRYSPKLTSWLRENVESYDAIIVHGLWLFCSHATERVMRGRKSPPWFIMPHGMLDPYFQQSKERRLKAQRNRIYWRLIENKVVNRASGILFTTEEELLLARETFPGYHPKKEINVGYGIQPPPEKSQEILTEFYDVVPQVKGTSFLLFLGRIHPKKGVDLLVKAFIELNVKSHHLVIAGPGRDSEYGKELIELIAKNKMDDRVIFPGMLQGSAKWGAFYEADAFVLPSHQENFGIAVAEAIACGTPVLISEKVNIWREIKGAECGFIRPDTLEGTKELLEDWLCTSSGAKAEMNDKSTRTFRNNFDINTNVQKLIEVLAESGK